ncbi:MAG: hypothetical protein JWN65_3036 [Solirubrobacterales bacterium]|jgi:hypothetical protein|nr:hypothetical protein [Solirubrobacterales bacterium]
MLHALLTLATAEAEPSKTAFYIGGGLLVAWALALGAIGMYQPDFPKTDGAARGVMGIGVGLTLVALVTVLITA